MSTLQWINALTWNKHHESHPFSQGETMVAFHVIKCCKTMCYTCQFTAFFWTLRRGPFLQSTVCPTISSRITMSDRNQMLDPQLPTVGGVITASIRQRHSNPILYEKHLGIPIRKRSHIGGFISIATMVLGGWLILLAISGYIPCTLPWRESTDHKGNQHQSQGSCG